MTYLIRQRGGRWLIYACGACILDCEDEATAFATIAAARESLRVMKPDNEPPVLAFPSQRTGAEAKKTAASRG